MPTAGKPVEYRHDQMAKPNPKLPAHAVGDGPPAPTRGLRRLSSKPILLVLPLLATGLLLSLIQAPIDASFLAWVALVPFALACRGPIKTRWLALTAWLIGSVYWLINIYWIGPITVAGWLAMGIYVGALWPLLAIAVRQCRHWRIPLFVALPVLIVGSERLQGFPLGGFYWRLLGHSQYAHITLIQIADVFGVAGVSFLVAMVNGLLADVILFLRDRRTANSPAQRLAPARIVVGAVVAVVAIVGTVSYGRWRIGQTDQFVSQGPLVAAVQSNVPQSVKGSHAASSQIFDELMASSDAAIAAGAQLIVWPETMVQGFLQPELWPSVPGFDWTEDKAFYNALCEHARQDGVYVMVGAYGGDILRDGKGERYFGQYNSAYLYKPDGTRDPNRYDKIHLVLFGEYIPFRRSFNWLYQQLKRFAPSEYNYDYSLEHGTEYTLFEMTTPIHGTEPNVSHRFGVIICYEDAIPYVARNFSIDGQGHKRVDWLVNISNDGWFVRFQDEPPRVRPSTELPQHAVTCVFRAVENRLPILRSVNTGVSCLIDSLGRIRNGAIAASEGLPEQAMNRTGMTGWFVDQMPIDTRVTVYSRFGPWLDNTCAVVFIAPLVWPVVGTLANRRAKASRSKSTQSKKRASGR